MPKGCRFCDRCPSAMTRCREENPELIHREGRMIRCFLYDDTNREESISMDHNERFIRIEGLTKEFDVGRSFWKKDKNLERLIMYLLT